VDNTSGNMEACRLLGPIRRRSSEGGLKTAGGGSLIAWWIGVKGRRSVSLKRRMEGAGRENIRTGKGVGKGKQSKPCQAPPCQWASRRRAGRDIPHRNKGRDAKANWAGPMVQSNINGYTQKGKKKRQNEKLQVFKGGSVLTNKRRAPGG